MSVAYFDFDLLLEKTDDGAFVRVLASPLGQASAPFVAPFAKPELDQYTQALAALQLSTVGHEPPAFLRSAGERLFVAVFRDQVLRCLRSNLQFAYENRAGLRLRIHLSNLPEVSQWPWEYLFDATRNEFLALTNHAPLVRYIDRMHQIPPLKVKPPLRMLTVIASPGRYPLFDVDEEWTAMLDRLDHLAADGKMTIDRLAKPTLLDLQRRLRERQYHLLQFIGHAHFDPQTQEGYLLFEDEMGRGRPVSGQHLGALLREHFALRFVALQACADARIYPQNPYSLVAQSVVQRGIPAALATQIKLPDDLRLAFMDELYAGVVAQHPIDSALSSARRLVHGLRANLAWGVPLLMMRTANGRLFDEQAPAEVMQKPARASILRKV